MHLPTRARGVGGVVGGGGDRVGISSATTTSQQMHQKERFDSRKQQWHCSPVIWAKVMCALTLSCTRLCCAHQVEVRASSRRPRAQTGTDSAIGKIAAAHAQREAREKKKQQVCVHSWQVVMAALCHTKSHLNPPSMPAVDHIIVDPVSAAVVFGVCGLQL